MATREEQLEKLRKLKQLQALRAQQAERATMQQELAQEVGAGESLLIGMGKGMTDIGRGLGLVGEEDQVSQQAFAALEEERPYTAGGGEILGQALPFVPLALGAELAVPVLAAKGALGIGATQAARIGAQGLIGVGEGGIIAEGTGRDVLEGAAIGGTLAAGVEAISPVLGRAASAVYRKLTGKVPVGSLLTRTGEPTPELQEALVASGVSFDDFTVEAQGLIDPLAGSAEEATRKAFLESQGLIGEAAPTRAQVSRDASDFMAQQEAAKTSGRVRGRLEAQEAVLSDRFTEAAREAASQSDSPVASVTDSIVGKSTALDKEISDLYKTAREIAPGEKNIKFNTLGKKLRSLMPSNTRMGGNIKAVVGELQTQGVLDDAGKMVGKIDVETAEGLRQYMNSLYDPANPFANSALRDLKDALDDDVFKAAGEDTFKSARRAKADYEKGLSRAKISKFDSRKANLVRDVLENKVSPDQFVDDVVNSKKWRAEDLKQLKTYLEADEAGAEAFKNLRGETVENIKERAFIGPEDAAGNRALSRNALEKSLKKIGRPKLEVLFDKKELKFLDDMMEVTRFREPVRGTQQGRGPSSKAIEKLEKRLANLPGLGGLVDFIDLDAQGRAVIKATPKRIQQEVPQFIRDTAAAAAVVGTPAILDEDRI